MRIAYVAPYQGAAVLSRRPMVINRSLSGSLKMGLIAGLLRSRGHDLEIISQGEVVENTWTRYGACSESDPNDPSIPVNYASALTVPRLNGFWSNEMTLRLLRRRHASNPFDVVMIWNMKGPQVRCARYAIRHLGLPVILEYEDDQFVDRSGRAVSGALTRYRESVCRRLLQEVSGGTGVSPHLVSQLPDAIPKMLLRGVVGRDLIAASAGTSARKNIILFSGTHGASNGVAELIEAWSLRQIAGWELHVTGHGQLTETLRQRAAGVPQLTFHGMVSREELVSLMASAKICINPHAISHSPGSLFAFKLLEYVAAGAHVITTPMGDLEPALETAITYAADNSPHTISATIERVIAERLYASTAREAALNQYGPEAVAGSLNELLSAVVERRAMSRAA